MNTSPKKCIPWDNEVNFAITLSDQDGKILHMNKKSESTFLKGKEDDLIGKNVLDCHPPAAKAKLADLLKSHETNAYTIEKNGQKKLIYQTPWYENGEFRGLVELSLVLPKNMPHYIRKN
ncbi:diguanylate cyclase [Candidatus Lokiarchaeum ossiferum]|uniref:diguanylate cyclase n=1 Tax=Candidatus Lokiarchaeum ossiferum TaxID=2951803 RepID=UPI00352CF2E1